MAPAIKHHTHLVQLNIAKPAHLPFHLLAWGQTYVKKHNCPTSLSSENDPPVAAEDNKKHKRDSGNKSRKSERSRRRLVESSKERVLSHNNEDVFKICSDTKLETHHRGGPVNVSYHRRSGLHAEKGGVGGFGIADRNTKSSSHHHHPIRYVYYTEMDQIVRFDSFSTLRALSLSSNDSCFFTGRRREKIADSEPEDYMGKINNWRDCGEPGYNLYWPKETIVRPTS